MEEKGRKTIYLTPDGVQVVLKQDEKGYLTRIVINKNKYLELVKNGAVDSESILEVEAIVLITMSGKRTVIPLEKSRQLLSVDKTGNVHPTGKFIFYVKEGEHVHSSDLRFNRKRTKKKSFNTKERTNGT